MKQLNLMRKYAQDTAQPRSAFIVFIWFASIGKYNQFKFRRRSCSTKQSFANWFRSSGRFTGTSGEPGDSWRWSITCPRSWDNAIRAGFGTCKSWTQRYRSVTFHQQPSSWPFRKSRLFYTPYPARTISNRILSNRQSSSSEIIRRKNPPRTWPAAAFWSAGWNCISRYKFNHQKEYNSWN